MRERFEPRRVYLQPNGRCGAWRIPGLLLALLVLFSGLTPIAASSAAQTQNPSVMTLVPAANWRPVSSEKLETSAISRWGGDPAVDVEYGVKSLESRTYQLDNGLAGGAQTAAVIIEEASDASTAYGLLTFYQTESMAPEKGMLLAVADRDRALMARGPVFLRFIKPVGSRISTDEFRALMILVAGTRPPASASLGLPTPMPAAGLVPGTEKYLLGIVAARRVLPAFPADLIGFTQGAEVQSASYALDAGNATPGSPRATVVAIAYPTPQIARERFALMEQALGLNQDRGPRSFFGKRGGSFIFVVIGEDSKAAAAPLIDLFNVTEEVTGIPRYPGKKSIVLQMLELILANLMLVGLLVGTAILGGVLIVLSKRLARRWFPNWEWGSPEGEQLTTLNLR